MGQDTALADLITLGDYTGARIEELFNLRVDQVRDTVLTIPDTKTDAAARRVPVHTALAPVVARLVADSKDGDLIPTTVDNQYGERSSAIGKRFGLLKTRLGFGLEHVFHSIRKTVATCWRTHSAALRASRQTSSAMISPP